MSGAYTEAIEVEALGGLRQHVEGYGLEVVRFGNFHIAMGEQDEQRLNQFYERASYVNMAGGLASQMMGNAQQQRQGGAVQTPGTTMGNVTCPSCNQSVAPGKFCAECGKPLAAAGPRFCTGCGKPVAGKFCGECGTPAPG